MATTEVPPTSTDFRDDPPHPTSTAPAPAASSNGSRRPVDHGRLDAELAGLDALELPSGGRRRRRRLLTTVWATAWPKLAAVALGLLAWQAVAASGWRPDYLLPGPLPVLRRLADDLLGGELLQAVAITLRRALSGFALAVLIGVVLGIGVARVRVLRAAMGSLVTGLQTMPSIAWFPLAILLFGLSESAMLFVVVLGAAPSIANGLVSGVDHIPPLLLRAGRVLGARGLAECRWVVLPAALPSFVGGLKQGWAFAWRSLMAGELLVAVAHRPSIGVRLQLARELSDVEGLAAMMLVVLVLGIAVDTLVFGTVERAMRSRRGLVDSRA